MDGGTEPGGVAPQSHLNLRSTLPILTLHQKQSACGAVCYDRAFRGKVPSVDTDMGGDDM